MSYTDYEWFLQKDLSAYFGKWVAIINRKVVASNSDVKKLISQVKKEHPHQTPLVTKVKGHLSIL